MALIEFRGVKKAFGPKVVYRSFDLDVFENESLTIIGGSGQGKSVMLKMLIGLLSVDEGTIHFDGQQISGLPERDFAPIRRRIAMLFQGAALFDSLNVGENVAYGLRGAQQYTKMSEEQIRVRVNESLAHVGLPDSEELWPADLSGGMKKRVGLARAIAIRPDVLLYDEPTTGLDPINIARINELILHMKSSLNITSIVVTHDMGSAFTVSDRIAMVHGGGIVFSGTPDEVRRTDNPFVRDFIEGNAEDLSDVNAMLTSAG